MPWPRCSLRAWSSTMPSTKNELQVRHRHVGRERKKGAAGGDGTGDHPGALLLPFQHGAGEPGRTAQRHAEGVGVAGHAPGLHIVDVVLQVLAHAGQVVHHRHTRLLQVGGRADARQLQQLRRPKGARRQDHLAPCPHRLQGAALVVGHARGAPALQRHFGRRRG